MAAVITKVIVPNGTPMEIPNIQTATIIMESIQLLSLQLVLEQL